MGSGLSKSESNVLRNTLGVPESHLIQKVSQKMCTLAHREPKLVKITQVYLTDGFFQLGESENGEVCIKTDFEIFLNAF